MKLLPLILLVLSLAACQSDSDREILRTSDHVMEINGTLRSAIQNKNWSQASQAQKQLEHLDDRLQSLIDGGGAGGSYDSARGR